MANVVNADFEILKFWWVYLKGWTGQYKLNPVLFFSILEVIDYILESVKNNGFCYRTFQHDFYLIYNLTVPLLYAIFKSIFLSAF